MKITSRIYRHLDQSFGMTREDFMKIKFKAYQSIDFKHTNLSEPLEVLLVAVNYDTEILTLRQFPDGKYFEEDDFHAHISHCKPTGHKIKIVK
jgi:hypothetical protein